MYIPAPSSYLRPRPPHPSCQVGKSSTLLPHLPPPPSSQVGKSSTLNSLLGSHRVAVSSHPG